MVRFRVEVHTLTGTPDSLKVCRGGERGGWGEVGGGEGRGGRIRGEGGDTPGLLVTCW
jgi:hypothetical protein